MSSRARVITRRVSDTTLVLLVVAGVLLLALVSAGGSSAVQIGEGWVVGFGNPEGADPPPCTPEELRQIPPPPHCEVEPVPPDLLSSIAAIGLGAFLLLLLALVMLGLAVLFGAVRLRVRWRRRRRVSSQLEELEAEEGDDATPRLGSRMHRAARSALDELLRQRAGGEPGDAVVAAWLVLEQEAALAGSARQAHQTPTEFTAAMLAEHRVDTAALGRLRALYQRARFGTRASLTDADVAAAEEALRRVVGDLAGSSP